MSLKRGITYIFGANIVNFAINIIISFLLPKYLCINTYSVIKTFQFYVGYIGIMHFGYVDGMYLKYGGKTICDIDQHELAENIATMRVFQVIIAVLGISICLIIQDYVLMACLFSVVPQNMKAYYSSLYSATGEFKQYAKLTNNFSILFFLMNMSLLYLGIYEEYIYYIVGYISIDVLLWGILEKKFCKTFDINTFFRIKVSFTCLYQNIRDGILLMLGNLSSVLLTGQDRWCIKIFMDNTVFAQYSFCVSLEGIINFVVLPMSRAFYNYFCIHKDAKSIQKLTDMVVVITTLLVIAVFPLKLIIEYNLREYTGAMNVLILLFATQIFYVCIKCVYLNLYKAFKKQKLYFIRLITIIVVGFVLNIILYSIYSIKEAFAVGTLICSIIWFIMSVFDFKEYMSAKKTYLYILAELIVFLFCGFFMNPVMGCGAYFLLTAVCICILMRKEFLFLWNELVSVFKRGNR